MGTWVHKQGMDEVLEKFEMMLASTPCLTFGHNIADSRGHIDIFTFWHFILQVPVAALHMQDQHWTVETHTKENHFQNVYFCEITLMECIMSTLKQYSQIKQDSFGQCLKIGNNLHEWQNNLNRFLELKNGIFSGNHHTIARCSFQRGEKWSNRAHERMV